MSYPKNHHYIPQSYQLLFSLDGRNLYYLDKKNNSKIIGPAGPRNFCSENFLYSLSDEAAKMVSSPTLIENPILSTIDGVFVSEVEKLISNNPDKTDVSLHNISRFLGALSARHPSLIEGFQRKLDHALILGMLSYARNDEKLKKKALDARIDLYDESQFEGVSFSESRNVTLFEMVKNLSNNANYMHDCMGWVFFYSYESDFLLCDNPFVIKDDPIEVDGLINNIDECIALIPLSRQLCLALSAERKDGQVGYKFVNAKQVQSINDLIIDNSFRWVIGATKESLARRAQ